MEYDEEEQIRRAIELSKRAESALDINSATDQDTPNDDASSSSLTSSRRRGGNNGILSRFMKLKRSKNQQGKDPSLYRARRSARVKKSRAADGGDGDTWIEAMAVSAAEFKEDGANGGIGSPTIRSYFYSKKTGERNWDEPPSGASNIQYATAEVRAMAEAQAAAMVQEMMAGGSSNPAAIGHDTELQAAIEASKMDAEQKVSAGVGGTKEQSQDDSMEEAIAMAMALSLSEQDTGVRSSADSKNQCTEIPYNDQDGSSDKKMPAIEEEDDRKMPAKGAAEPASSKVIVPIVKFISTDAESLKADQRKTREIVATDDLLNLHIPVATANGKKAGSVELVLAEESFTGIAVSPHNGISHNLPQDIDSSTKEKKSSSAALV